jgi:Trypsin-like peptidase domain
MLRMLASILLLALLLGTVPAQAVIVASGDGTQNTTAPPDDPGWANVGIRGGLSAVYLGNRWVVTAAHVGIGSVTFGGVPYDAIPGSTSSFETAPGQIADLIVFKLREDPGLPALTIASAAPPSGADVVMIGNGRNRGAATQWSGIDGWLWGAGAAMRWGTNRVGSAPANVTIGSNVSLAFWTEFTKTPTSQVTAHEAQAATGDSGGALFVENAGAWELGGTLFAINTFGGQPANSAFYGNRTYAVDLSSYRSAILVVTTKPACNDGIEDDGDGLVDFPNDPGCASADDLDERSPLLACDDGADNDGDGLTDSPADPGCRDPASTLENPSCDDDLDNDGDGAIDWDGGAALGTADSYCVSNGSWQNREKPPRCGLGSELVLLVPLLAHRRRRKRA